MTRVLSSARWICAATIVVTGRFIIAAAATDDAPLDEGCAHVVSAEGNQETGSSTWSISVAVRSFETGDGWDKYANEWKIKDADTGSILGVRTLGHPHVNEQPFERSLGGVVLPEIVGGSRGKLCLVASARDSVGGYCGQEYVFCQSGNDATTFLPGEVYSPSDDAGLDGEDDANDGYDGSVSMDATVIEDEGDGNYGIGDVILMNATIVDDEDGAKGGNSGGIPMSSTGIEAGDDANNINGGSSISTNDTTTDNEGDADDSSNGSGFSKNDTVADGEDDANNSSGDGAPLDDTIIDGEGDDGKNGSSGIALGCPRCLWIKTIILLVLWM